MDKNEGAGLVSAVKKILGGVLGGEKRRTPQFERSTLGVFAYEDPLYTVQDKKVIVPNSISKFTIKTSIGQEGQAADCYLPSIIVLQLCPVDVEHEVSMEVVVHEEVPYSPVKLEIKEKYKDALVITLERMIGAQKFIRIILPMQEGEISNLPAGRGRSSKNRMHARDIPESGEIEDAIGESEFISYAADFLEFHRAEYRLEVRRIVQSVEMKAGSRVDASQIIAMTSATKCVPLEHVPLDSGMGKKRR